MKEEWVELLVTYDSLEAEMIKDLLESGGIPVVLRSSKVSPYPVNVGKIGEIKILVRQEDLDIAERVIKGDVDGGSLIEAENGNENEGKQDAGDNR